ncbi:MAG TPA: hypothetical protein VFU29_03100 [Chitinophagaceae bacterium]|nr:hypothetical protein [Chitinophagaceae bacterium]
MKLSANKIIAPLVLIIILFSCKKNSESNPGDGNGSGTGTGNGTVQGVITDLNNSPLSNATVTGGTATATSDASGKFTLSKVQFSSNTVVVIVTKNGFFEGSKNFASSNNTVSNVKIQLIPKTVLGTIAASSGGDITLPGGGSINFSPGFVTASNGNAYSGNVSVSAHYFNPSDPNFSAYTPGDLKAAGFNNPQGALQSFGVVTVEMDDASGNKLQLAAGNKATVTLPTALQGKAPLYVPLWYFDATKGAWKQDGIAEKQGSNYISTVSHFSYWNPGNIVDTSQYIRLTLNGIDYSWSPSDSGGIDVQYHEPYDTFHDATILRGGEMNNYFKGKIVNNSSHSVGNYPFILLAVLNGKNYSTVNNPQATVTENGPVGGYVKGSASGLIKSTDSSAVAFTCSYKVIRIQ